MSWDFTLYIERQRKPDPTDEQRKAIEDVAEWLRDQRGDGPELAEQVLRLEHLGASRVEVFDANYTYNVSEMLFAAFGSAGHHKGIRALDGMIATDAAPLLEAVLRYFDDHEAELEAMNPSNGWGSRQGIYGVLVRMLDASRAHSSGVWEVL